MFRWVRSALFAMVVAIWAAAPGAAHYNDGFGAAPLIGEISAAAFTYLPDELTIKVGTGLHFTNFDPEPHNLIASRNGPKGSPLFSTDTIGAATTVAIKGTDKLAPGTYDFFCTLHPEMVGTLFVEGVPRG